MTAVMPYRPPLPARSDPATLANTVTDISCTHCRRTLRNVTLLEIAWSKPCPMCARCEECRELCLEGRVLHGMES